ncbi:MAG: hypothetical protein ACTH9T_05165 [Mycetocola reblochoni]|uniref:hypothetical protein n=1 Tax=Mycetocola reblochoni TaxID=331618 RepID=UPI003F95E673
MDGNVIGTVDQLDFHQADGSTNREPLELCLIADTDIGRMDICLEDAKSLLRILPILIALADKKPLTRRTGTGQPEAAA